MEQPGQLILTARERKGQVMAGQCCSVEAPGNSPEVEGVCLVAEGEDSHTGDGMGQLPSYSEGDNSRQFGGKKQNPDEIKSWL